MPPPLQEWRCVCNKVYLSRSGLRQHQRTVCRPSMEAASHRCGDCGQRFSTLAGLSLHRKATHPDDYNRELELEAAGKNKQWTDFETRKMARLESKFQGRFINKYLADLMDGRPRESIRSRRKTTAYKTIKDQLDLEAAATAISSPSSSSSSSSITSTSFPNTSSVSNPVNTDAADDDEEEDDLTLEVGEEEEEDDSDIADVFEPAATTVSDPVRDYLVTLQQDLDPEDQSVIQVVLAKEHHARDLVERWARQFLHLDRTKAEKPAERDARGPRRGCYRAGAGRATEFKTFQRAYAKNKRKLAAHIFDQAPLANSGVDIPSKEAIEEEYTEIFGSVSPEDKHPFAIKDPGECFYQPFTKEQVAAALATAQDSSSGTDGVTIKALRAVSLNRIVALFNAMLYLAYTPRWLKTCRTTLISKGGHRADINNWRPITISSMVLRTFNRIMAGRLNRIPINLCQRGFRSVDGCLINGLILQSAIKEARMRTKEHYVLTLDLRKAFDSVSHESIDRALRRWDVHPNIRKLVMDGYDGCTTTIHCEGTTTSAITIRRGVKQGDPLSPTLFNLVMDELIERIDPAAGLELGGGPRVAVLAYADDLILMGGSKPAASDLLQTTISFLEDRHLALNIRKCTALAVGALGKKKKNFVITSPQFFVGGAAIPIITPTDTFRYLGHSYGFMGHQRLTLANLLPQLRRLQTAALKPYQKMVLLKQHLIPRYLFYLQSPTVGKCLLEKFDVAIRGAVKKILHLHKTISSSYVHADLKSGGLGVIALSSTVPVALHGRLNKLNGGGDPFATAALSSDYGLRMQGRVGRLATAAGSSKDGAKRLWGDRLEVSWSGNGMRQGHHSATTSWIGNPPKYWSGKDYVKASQLRGNALPTRGIMSNPPHLRSCRAGCERVESVCHVLQACPATHWPRIRRHDHVVGLLRDFGVRAGYQVDVEPHFRCSTSGLKKPDLVFLRDDKIIVSDVQISWEGPRPLTNSFQNKICSYGTPDFISEVERRYPGRPVFVQPFIMGARGTWCDLNRSIHASLALRDGDVRRLTEGVLLGGVRIHALFGKVTWRGRPPPRGGRPAP